MFRIVLLLSMKEKSSESLIRKETSENELGLLMAGYTLEEARKELKRGLAHMNHRSEKFRNLLVPVLSVVLGLILGAILMAALVFSPSKVILLC